MDLIAIIGEYGGWSWVVAGMVLLAIELVAPGGFFIWLGGAAVVTGIAALLQPIGAPFQWMLFGVLSLTGLGAWMSISRRRKLDVSDRPLLNARAQRYVGQEVILDEPIIDGFGRVRLGDSTWRVSGPDLPTGQKIRIIGHDGAVLKVESAG